MVWMPHNGYTVWLKPGSQDLTMGCVEKKHLYVLEGTSTCNMPPLQYAALSRFSLKHTLGWSNLWGSSLTLGDLHCSFAPAHLYQMISSSTSNLLTLIPILKAPPPLPPLVSSPPAIAPLFPFRNLLSSSSSSLLLLSFSVSSQVCVGVFWDGRADRDRSRAVPLKGVCVRVCSVWHLLRSKKTKRSLVWLWRLICPCSYFCTAPYWEGESGSQKKRFFSKHAEGQ